MDVIEGRAAKLEELTDKDVAVFDELGSGTIKGVQADTHVVMICLDGCAHCSIEGREYHIAHGDMLICHPTLFVDSAMVNLDFRCRGIVLSPRYLERMAVVGGNYWDVDMALKRTPVLHLDDEEMAAFLFNFDIIKRKLTQTALPHYHQSIQLLLQSLLYELYDRLAPRLRLAEDRYTYTSAESLFKRFGRLLAAESPQRHDVRYYATALCITPKYLSAVCKRQTGKTATELINSSTLRYVRNMLLSSDKTIKQIAADAGFTNLSFFGKYVRRTLGMSPRDFRARHACER